MRTLRATRKDAPMKTLSVITAILVTVASMSTAEVRQSFGLDFEIEGQDINDTESSSDSVLSALLIDDIGEDITSDSKEEGLALDFDASAAYRISNTFSNGLAIGFNLGLNKTWSLEEGFSDLTISKAITLDHEVAGVWFEVEHDLDSKNTEFSINKSFSWNW